MSQLQELIQFIEQDLRILGNLDEALQLSQDPEDQAMYAKVIAAEQEVLTYHHTCLRQASRVEPKRAETVVPGDVLEGDYSLVTRVVVKADDDVIVSGHYLHSGGAEVSGGFGVGEMVMVLVPVEI
jgi:hypothetical protein